jgi:hypothetical protein
MYPGVFQAMAQKISNEMVNSHANEEPVPYKVRLGMSLFLGQPIDGTMNAASIMAAQPKPPQNPQQPQGGGQKMPGRKGASSLGKSTSQYNTPGQTAERDRASRE